MMLSLLENVLLLEAWDKEVGIGEEAMPLYIFIFVSVG